MLTDNKTLISRFERQAHRMGELWERCQGKDWPDAESAEFTALRDERLPAMRAALEAIESAACAPLLERIAELEADRDQVRGLFNKSKDEFHTARQESSLRWQMICDLTNQRDALEAKLAQRVPDGWQLVPVAPTHMMELKGSISWENSGQESPDVVEIYQVMLAAAPAAPEQQEPKSPCACRPGMMCNRSATCADEIRRDAAQAPNAQQAEAHPVAGQSRFPGVAWSQCDVEHVRMVQANPDDWKGYQVRLLYTAQPKAVPLTKLQRLSMEELEAIFQCGGDVYTNVQSALAAKNGMELVGAPEEKGGE